MVFFREFASGVVLCVLCCAAVIYSFYPSRQGGTNGSKRDFVDIASAAGEPFKANEPALVDAPAENTFRGGDSVSGNREPLFPVERAQEMSTVERTPSNDLPYGITHEGTGPMSVSAGDEVRWLRVPAEDASQALPVEAEAMPPFGSQAYPELDIHEPLVIVAGDHGDGAIAPGESGLGEAAPGNANDPLEEGGLLQPELVANRPSLPDPGAPDLLLNDPDSEMPAEINDGRADSSEGPSLELFHAGDVDPVAEQPVWCSPTDLIERVDALATQPQTQAWARAVADDVEALGLAMEGRSEDAGQLLDTLECAVAEGVALANQVTDPLLATNVQRTAHALRRRIDVWRYASQLTAVADREPAAAPYDWDQIALSLEQVEAYVGDSATGRAWREYLLIDALQQWSSRRQADDAQLGQKLAQESLERLTAIPMDSRQRHFIASRPVNDLKAQLQQLAAAPVDFGQLLGHLESYERHRLADDARRITRDYRRLALADSELQQALAARLSIHYRNANIRFAVSESLLNRLMPTREPEFATVNDIVLGVQAHGQRATSTDMQVRLIPDAHRARLALDVRGRIISQTTSSSGPATFLTNSLGTYIARKPLELDLDGIRVAPAEVRVSNDIHLRGVRTEFDGLPLVGSLVNSVARSQHAQNQPAANAEIRGRIYREAKGRIDREADARLTEVSNRLRTRLLEPMRRLRLDPVMIDAGTTEERLNMRVRLAGEEQLGSHTPRPRAPHDSLASFQLHESAINNVLERLDLNGRTFTLAELSQHVAMLLNKEGWLQVGPEHEDVSLTFAAANAVAVRCHEGRVGVTLSIDQLRHERRVWRDFQVQAFYRPETQGISANLVRDGVIQLSGSRLPLGSQIALRGIFVRIFASRRPWDLLPHDIAENPNLADLEITQFVIDDGWMGLALGPQRMATRPRRLLR